MILQQLLVLVALAAPPQDSNDAAMIVPRGSAAEVSVAEVADELARRDVVFLGEEHDSDAGHAMQLAIIQALHERRPDLVISMEMFERDVQGVVDDYLAWRIEEDEFLEHSRPWGNYPEHYRPIVEFAKENNLDVIAGNVPRRIASGLASGTPANAADAVYAPRSTSAPEDAYWENFLGVMGGHGGTDDSGSMQRFYAAQCIKDDAMAEAIADYLAVHPHRKPLVVHLCGKFHSDGGLGTVSRLVDRCPLMQTGVVSMQTIDSEAEIDVEELRDQAHYTVIVRRPAQDADDGDTGDGDTGEGGASAGDGQ